MLLCRFLPCSTYSLSQELEMISPKPDLPFAILLNAKHRQFRQVNFLLVYLRTCYLHSILKRNVNNV